LAQTARTCVGDAFPLVAGAKRAVPQVLKFLNFHLLF